MSKYKQAMIKKGIMQKELLDGVRKADARVDKPLLSKIVNDICLPNRVTLKSICNVLQCEPLDIYEKDEINLAGRRTSQNKDTTTEDLTAKTFTILPSNSIALWLCVFSRRSRCGCLAF